MGDDNDSDVGDDDDDKAEDVINDNDLEDMGEETSEEDRDAQLRDPDQIGMIRLSRGLLNLSKITLGKLFRMTTL